MPNDSFGLPLRPLIAHATVVMVPLAAVSVVLAAVWPRFRSWAGPLPAVISLIGMVVARIGHSCAKAAWDDTDMSSNSQSGE